MGSAVRILLICLLPLLLAAGRMSASPVQDAYAWSMPFQKPLGAVIIDPGHGGSDPGAIGMVPGEDGGQRQLTEKEVNLDISFRLQEKLSQLLPDIEIHLLRDDDTYLSLYRRVQRANSVIPPEGTSRIFVSIHANAAHSPTARGFELWVYRGRKTGRFIEPAVNEPDVVKLTEQLNEELHRELQQTTDLLSASMADTLKEHIGGDIPPRGIKERDFYVIRHTLMPAVLVEAGFLTHPEEVLLLDDPDFRTRIADAIAQGIVYYSQQMEQN